MIQKVERIHRPGVPPEFPRDLVELACEILRQADRSHPADAVLRSFLRARRNLTRASRSLISEAVFSYYRWQGWLRSGSSLTAGLAQAIGLDRAWRDQPDSFTDAELRENTIPAWIHRQMTVSLEWLRALQMPPKIWLRTRPGQTQELARRLGDCHPFPLGIHPTALHYTGTQNLFETLDYRQGLFELQDICSQAVGWLCNPQPGQTWWDVCAGEGGKTLHLADLMKNQGLIWATDRAGWRLNRLRQRAARSRVYNCRTRIWNNLEHPPFNTRCDGVLVDAPCSGIGTWHRNPQARWTTSETDVLELAHLQEQLLHAAASRVKPLGSLVYSVCTLTRAETTSVADRFEERHPEFKPHLVNHPFSTEAIPQARFTFLPQEHQGNGMFVAIWQRTENPGKTRTVV
ncbi:MAG TPA: RsmB/NOP family class I SAM-dependent RNA methyltransferase [Candidatus Paceibacterota bacterium]|nr:RsmB/NOP family class I SAM-dependent RNA methyltransferase [Verrucomicrobiota bacterium]HSA00311.1 RsmB/NOP family class I SAM-dependent RNA methyltransferase [Candidatus Paceibacterota bacterium]